MRSKAIVGGLLAAALLSTAASRPNRAVCSEGRASTSPDQRSNEEAHRRLPGLKAHWR